MYWFENSRMHSRSLPAQKGRHSLPSLGKLWRSRVLYSLVAAPAYVSIPPTRFLQDWTPTKVPSEINKGLAFFPGAVSVQTFSEGEREHIESRLVFQRAYDSVDIISNGRPVEGGTDLDKAHVLAGVIDQMTGLVGKRPDCVHVTTREGGQIHTSHSDKMKFDVRSTVHLGADVLLGGQVDSTKSTGDCVLSSGGLSQPLQLRMRSGDAYIATAEVLHAPFLHGIRPPDQASLSIVCTWSPGRGVFNLFQRKSRPLIETFSSLGGVKAVGGDAAFEVTTTERVPPKKVEARIRQPGDFTGGVSLFQAPPRGAGVRIPPARHAEQGQEGQSKRR